ncbi:hypothetical protein ACW5WG_21025, partial [Aeromonas salmonicida]
WSACQKAPSVTVTWGWGNHDLLADLGNNAVRHIFKPISYLEIQLLSGLSGGYIMLIFNVTICILI